MHWLIDGYNVIRRDPALASRERMSLEAGRDALCRRLMTVARASGDRFTVVFDGAGHGGAGGGGAVRVLFSSARESADRVLARMATRGGAVVSNDREVRRAAARAGALAISADEFLARLERLGAEAPDRGGRPADATPHMKDEDEEPERPAGPRKGNPRRLPRKQRAAARALGRLGKSRL
ncbi:MAG TPA: NYN domain-containing protein [Methylomirabilota bacterium]|nr:NYN domain-containing protein [Methylomirabilota bacterium]